MAKVTFTDKDKTGVSPVNKWRDIDANEVKDSINAIYDHMAIGVGFYLPVATPTPVNANTWTDIQGTLVSMYNSGFTLGVDGVTYTGAETIYVECDAHASIESSNNTNTIYGSVYKNGELVVQSVMTTFAKDSGHIYNFSGTSVFEISTGDVLTMHVKASVSSTITFHNLTATVRPFVL